MSIERKKTAHIPLQSSNLNEILRRARGRTRADKMRERQLLRRLDSDSFPRGTRCATPPVSRRLLPIMKVQNLAIACGVVLALSACGGGTLPRDQLTSAESAVRAAEVGGAADNPKAALHLKYARDQVAEAKRLIDEEDFEAAEPLLARAEVDGELALALARVEAARAEAQAALSDVEELKKKQAESQEATEQ
jgi:hypothetical protein